MMIYGQIISIIYWYAFTIWHWRTLCLTALELVESFGHLEIKQLFACQTFARRCHCLALVCKALPAERRPWISGWWWSLSRSLSLFAGLDISGVVDAKECRCGASEQNFQAVVLLCWRAIWKRWMGSFGWMWPSDIIIFHHILILIVVSCKDAGHLIMYLWTKADRFCRIARSHTSAFHFFSKAFQVILGLGQRCCAAKITSFRSILGLGTWRVVTPEGRSCWWNTFCAYCKALD